MIPWLQSGVLDDYDVIELAAYKYGVTTSQQLLQWTHAGVFIRRTHLERGFLLHADDRYFYKDGTIFPRDSVRVKLMAVSDADGEPMVHHFSTARATPGLLKRKMLLSGHFDDSLPKYSYFGFSSLVKSEAEEAYLRSKPLDDLVSDDTFTLDALSAELPHRIVAPFVTFG
jgi:hypothetical protein